MGEVGGTHPLYFSAPTLLWKYIIMIPTTSASVSRYLLLGCLWWGSLWCLMLQRILAVGVQTRSGIWCCLWRYQVLWFLPRPVPPCLSICLFINFFFVILDNAFIGLKNQKPWKNMKVERLHSVLSTRFLNLQARSVTIAIHMRVLDKVFGKWNLKIHLLQFKRFRNPHIVFF